jgi:hypothetical protein
MVCVSGFFVHFLSETVINLLNESVIITFGLSFFYVLYSVYSVYDH